MAKPSETVGESTFPPPGAAAYARLCAPVRAYARVCMTSVVISADDGASFDRRLVLVMLLAMDLGDLCG